MSTEPERNVASPAGKQSVSISTVSLEKMVSSKVKQQMTESSDKLLENIDKLVSDRLGSHLHDIKKISSSDDYKFKKRGNEEQYKVNKRVLLNLEDAEEALSSVPADPNVTRATREVVAGKTTLEHRQKLLKLADGSDLGWKLVDEYETNALADDSDDEKRIFKAESRASKKQREQRTRSSRARGNNRSFFSSRPDEQAARITPDINSRRREGLCFACGRPGHWRFECRAKAPQRVPETSSTSVSTQGQGQKLSMSLNVLPKSGYLSETDSEVFKKQDTPSVQGNSQKSPAGSLYSCLEQWVKYGANPYILDVVENGYKIPFMLVPPKAVLLNNASARKEVAFVNAEVSKLLALKCVSVADFIPHVINPLTVAVGKSGKFRLVLDCRHVNNFVYKQKFRMEDSKVARHMFDKGDFLFTFDLKSAYHHIEIFREHRTFLGFAWNHNELGLKYFVFNVLPFGISSAAYIFTKTLRTLVRFWRANGLKIIMYLDDGLGGSSTFHQAALVSQMVRYDLENLGFLISHEKCVWLPSLSVVWLGLVFNSDKGTIHITEERVFKLLKAIKIVLDKCACHELRIEVRSLAAIAGQIQSLREVFGPIVSLRTRFMYYCIDSRIDWFSKVMIDSLVVDELRFWFENAMALNEQKFVVSDTFSVMSYSDASATGFGGYIVDTKDSEVCGSWTAAEAIRSSTWRELEAVKRVLLSLIMTLKGQSVQWVTDNTGVVSILQSGSRKPYLHYVALDVWNVCQEHDITLSPVWVPRERNSEADFLSKCGDSDDWEVTWDKFTELDTKWGPHDVDRFASNYNSKCTRFNSRWWCPGTEAVDAFSVRWSNTIGWYVPPPRLVAQVIAKMRRDVARGTLIVPVWFSAPFWPLLFPDGKATFVSEFVNFSSSCIISGKGRNGIFGDNSRKVFQLMAVKIQF